MLYMFNGKSHQNRIILSAEIGSPIKEEKKNGKNRHATIKYISVKRCSTTL